MKKPAISLIVAGGILALYGLFIIFAIFAVPSPSAWSSSDANQKLVLLKAGAMLYGVILVSLSSISIWGGIAMLQQGKRSLCMAGSICTVIGGLISGLLPGWLLILPIGIWGIVVLRRSRSPKDT